MEFTLRKPSFAELIISFNDTVVKQDISKYQNGKHKIEFSEIEKIITLAFDMNRFNNESDVKLVKVIFNDFLNGSEKEQIVEYVSELIK